ncbi:Histone-lysine N-methyltransferase 2C [Trichinella papuae]|uniref:Histone-lysine N-methyltransferase 2C n=1 Tax=Trichinella papuae TaxID=268474 RepID=A0A0V1MV30_9BILA|nr:Histone-lysine N-methyltransferase 2C [Trichinella papuae]
MKICLGSEMMDLSYSHTSVEPVSLPPQNMITGHALSENVSRKKISNFKRNSASKGKGGSSSSRSMVDKRRSQKCAKNRRNAVQTITEILNHHLAPNVAKHKEDDEYIHSVVVTSVKDSYVFCRDMCVVCGSFGRGQEGHMVACTQCGQCYHTYCANVTLNSVIVHRGWRCLDCTVCEGCGTGDDEQHLLLCDECDVSYHMYCLDPPLDSIPQGAWRCKWCSTCQFCGATPPNGMLDSIKNLRACFKCASLYSCCFCHLQYKEEDMIILCDICHRWSHANCNGFCAEDILKKGLDAGFICVYCRPGDACSSGGDAFYNSRSAMHFVIEGVLLTKSGLSTVQWRPKPAASPVCSSAVYNSAPSFESLQNATTDGFSELSTTSQLMIQDGVVSASPDLEKLDFEFSSNSDLMIYESQNGLDSFGSMDRQKRVRNRKLFKVGIGGFHTRLARSRYDKLQEECVATASPEMMGNSLGGNQLDNNAVAAVDSIVEDGHDKPKRRKRNRRKVVLEDYYPSYIQEAFFGISAEENSYTNGGGGGSSSNSNANGPAPFPLSPFDLQEQDIAFAIPRSPDTEINSEVIKNAESSSQVYKLRNANVLPEVCLNEAIDMNENEEIFPHELQNHDFTNLLDMLMQADMDPIVSNTDISAIDSVEMDTLMDNVFDAELKRTSELTETPQLLANSAEMHQANGRCLKDSTALCGDNAPTPFVPLPVEIGTSASQMAPKSFNEQTDLVGNMAGNIFPNSSNSNNNSNNGNNDNNNMIGGMVESAAVRPRVCESPPVEAKNYLDRWLQDEPLGDRSSIAAVLYANLNAPDLKTRYPCWPDRAKCIAKIWRSLNQDHRQQYVQMARENRSLMRQECKARRQQQQQQQQQQQPCLLASSPAVRRSSASGGGGGGHLMKLIESRSPPSVVNCAATSDSSSNPMPGATPAPMPLNINVADDASHRADIPMKPPFPVIRDFFPFQQRLFHHHHYHQHFPQLLHHNHHSQEDQQRQMKNFMMNFSQREFFQNHDGTAAVAQHQHPQQRKFSLPEDGLAFAMQKNDVIKQPGDHQYGMMVNTGESFRLGKAEHLDALARRASCPSSAEALVGMAACCNNSLSSSALAPAPVLSPSQTQISARDMRSPPASWSQQQQQQQQQHQQQHYQQQQRHYHQQQQQHQNPHPQSALTAPNFGVLAMNGNASGLGAGQVPAEPSPSTIGTEMMKPTMNITAPPYYQRMMPVRGVPLDSTVAVAPGMAPPPPDPPLPPEFAAAYVNEGLINYSMPGRRFAPHPLGDVGVEIAATAPQPPPPLPLPIQPPPAPTPAPAPPPPPPYHHHHHHSQPAYDGMPDDETILSRTKCLNLCTMSRCYGSEVVATVKDLLDRVSDDDYGEATEAVLHMFSKIYPTDQCYDFDGPRRKGKGQLSRKRSRRSNKAKSFCGNEDSVDEMGELTDHQWFYYLQQLPPLTIVEPESRFDTAITHFYGVTPLTDCKGLVEGTLGKVTLSFAEDYYRRSCGGDGARNNSLVRMAESSTKGQTEKSFPNVKVENDLLFENRSSNSPDELIYSDGSADEETLPCYPYLKPEMSADGRLSPNFRLVAPVPVRAVPGDPPAGALSKTINEFVQSQQSRVVTLTLDSAAASNVSNVLRNLACLLNVDVPELFDLQIDTPPHTPDRVLSREYAETQRRFCCYCATALQQAMVKKNLAELGLTPKNDDSDEVVFCSDACFVQFAVSRKMPISPGNPTKVLPNKTVITSGLENALERSSSSMPICAANQQLRIAESENNRHRLVSNIKLDEIIRSVVGTSKVYTGTSKESVVHVRDLPRLKDTVEVESENQDASHYESKIEKKLKGARWQLYNNCQKSLLKVLACNTPEALWKEMLSIFWLPQSLPQDTRICELCSRMGDGETEVCGRLLNMDAGRWVHVNCVLWSAEVYETMDGGLVNVEQAVRRASVTRCVLCDLPGATIPCYKMKCGSNFHLHCAVDSRCTFMMDKTMFCFEHPPLCRDKILYNLAVFRKVYIERDDEQLLSKLYQQSESGEYAMRIGSLLFHHVGQLLPEQLNQFHTKDCIFPVDYTVSRIYWSTFHPRRRQIYQCHIGEFEGAPLFTVTAKYPGTAEVRYQSKSINEIWQNNILTPLQGLRNCNDILKLFPSYISGESFFGLFEPSIQKMLESLPGIDSLVTYEFKYGRSLWMEPPLVLNPSGSARCEPCFRTYIKRSRKLNAMSAHSIQSLLAFSGMPSDGYFYSFGNKQSLVAKCYQYRKLKQEWKSNVYLARSKIQGLGLFANRDVEMNAMVIEYVGEVIRNEVAERREKSYQKRNRGVYMFRLDSDHVIDATVAGGPARYINHSCDPNCIAERIDFDRESRIVIMSCRPICKGEELTYDYQFDFEDELNKLPCLCRAPNCRKWMN